VLLRADGDAVICITQPAHAWISGQLARAWGNAAFGAVEPWEEVCLAAEQHDIGMARWDAEPTLNLQTGLPHGFTEMPRDTHLALWSAAPASLAPQSPHAALLVSMHGTALYEARGTEPAPPVAEYLGAQRDFQESVIAELGLDRAQVARNQRLVWTWDSLSLALCLGWAPFQLRDVPTASEAVGVGLGEGDTLAPWPFAARSVEVRCEGRRLEGRFDDEEAMRAALRAAPLVPLSFALAPGEARAA
jgi:hypothetical protein